MAYDYFRMTAIIPAPPARVYAAWLDSKEHADFTGGHATIEPGVGGAHTAWDGYISGRHVELVPGKKIVQTWRTSEFPAEAVDSRLELQFEPRGPGGNETTLTLIHTEIPVGQGALYKEGWGEHYFEPMRAYFEEASRAPARAIAARPAATAAKKPTATPEKKPARKAEVAPTKTVAKKAPAKKAPAKKVTKKAPAKKVARKAPAKKAAGKKVARKAPKKPARQSSRR
jgi:uncharacterized protein YndB with AHSA1/START domain